MSGSPSRSSRRLPRQGHHGVTTAQWDSQQHNDGLQIRVVPYSPPRIISGSSSHSQPDLYKNKPQAGIPSPGVPDFEPDQGHVHIPDTAQEPRTKPSVSGSDRPLSSLTTPSSAHSVISDNASMSSRASSPGHAVSRRPRKIISINSDNKTFSLHPQSATESSPSSRACSFGSPQISFTTPSSSWGRVSSNVFSTEDCSSSPSTPQTSRHFSQSPTISPAAQQVPFTPIPPSPWNYRMKGGVRKVDRTPDSKGKQPAFGSESSADETIALPVLVENASQTQRAAAAPQLSPKESFRTQTSESNSTLSERTNYKVYGGSSPIRPSARDPTANIEPSRPPSSSHSGSNYHILGESSSENQSVSDLARSPTNDSDANYVILRGPSASCSSLGTNRSLMRSEYSRESLRVAPLRPVKQRRSSDQSGVFKSRSRESLRRGSLTSLGAALAQEATRALFAGPPTVYPLGSTQRDGSQGYSHEGPNIAPYPHHWGRPLSTVMSESEGASLSPTRSPSGFSGFSALSAGDRRSSTHSRNLLSMTSSLGGLDEQMATLGPRRSPSPDRSAPLYPRTHDRHHLGKLPMDYDEERDGLGDLQDLHHRSSRTRLVHPSADRVLRSSGSTRSLNPFSLPTWARLYYGGGDRRFLIAQASSESIRSLYNGSMYNDPPYNSFLRQSPSVERFNAAIRNPRRRPWDLGPEMDPYEAAAASTAIRPAASNPVPSPTPSRMRSIARGVKKQTSSIWSPHLRRDRRASKFSMWDPPSAVWSTESGFDWRRNQQVVLFVLGFIVPFAWMVAAFLPLPPRAQAEMAEDANIGHSSLGHDPSRVMLTLDEVRYNSARWWRNLNRGMSVVGLILIGAAVALIIVGVQQQWGV